MGFKSTRVTGKVFETLREFSDEQKVSKERNTARLSQNNSPRQCFSTLALIQKLLQWSKEFNFRIKATHVRGNICSIYYKLRQS
jgi:hypothetical protein